MRSIKFPSMFNGNSTKVWEADEYRECTYQNAITLLLSQRGTLLGDPYFGSMIRHFLYDQNTSKIQDYLVDTIYTQLALFIPQIKIRRQDIKLVKQPTKGKVHCTFKGVNQLDFQNDLYSICIFKESNE